MDFQKALNMIRSAHNILLTTHVRPDGDALGSLCGLGQLIEYIAKQQHRDIKTTSLLLSDPPDLYQFILPENIWVCNQIQNPHDIEVGQLTDYDLIIVADTSATKQLPGIGPWLKNYAPNVLIIDHHVSSDIEGRHRLVDTSAAACAQIITELARQADWSFNPVAAQALYAAIATDTGWFRFESCTAQTYRDVADLVEAGAQPAEIYQNLFQNDPPERLALMTRTMETLELHADNRIALMQITCEMLKETGANRSHIENLVNIPQQIASVIAVALMVELDDKTVRCSLRSRGNYDVNKIANTFNGGGHTNAAGLSLKTSLDQAKPKILDALKQKL
jgi:nanoRNase/pAp phosphatase (c-di-AMP/oligoRNAs hydrolase)